MSVRTCHGGERLWVIVCAIIAILCGNAAQGSPIINYGDSPPLAPGIVFQQVRESSGTDAIPLFGAPSYTAPPPRMHFTPAGFTAFGTGGASDITDGQLNYGVKAVTPGVGINTITVNEGGDFTLVGTGTTATQVLAGVIFNVTVDEVDGAPITPITFSSPASFGANLLANPGIVQPWSMSTSVAIAAELTALNIPYEVGATHVEVAMDNQLVAFSEAQSAAFIAKKIFDITLVSDVHNVPEPVSLALAGVVSLLSLRRRRA